MKLSLVSSFGLATRAPYVLAVWGRPRQSRRSPAPTSGHEQARSEMQGSRLRKEQRLIAEEVSRARPETLESEPDDASPPSIKEHRADRRPNLSLSTFRT
jgi:hypothetical protein